MTVFFITPWAGDTKHLLPDFIKAVEGGMVIVIDNGTPAETSEALADAAIKHDWYIYTNESNIGFSPANNQGWKLVQSLAADTDIICFLNSDVKAGGLAVALAGNVRDESLYGPSMQQQLVLGRWLPYLEGWCIAATLNTWKRLKYSDDTLWPEEFAPAYWEDNLISLRALDNDLNLIHLQLPLEHLGGQSGGIAMMGEVLERNRTLFTNEARHILKAQPAMSPTRQRYLRELQIESDIRHHLPLLYSLASGLVVELGTRTGVSTTAFLAGVEIHGGHVISIDIEDVSRLYRGHQLWTCIQSDSRLPGLPLSVYERHGRIDTLLIDTEHTYEQVLGELMLWAPFVKAGGHILCHDTETFPGVRAAIETWLSFNQPNAQVHYVLPNNGMAVIKLGAVVATRF